MPRPSRWNDVVEAAGKVFQEKGFAAASLEDIASELGMWKGSLYHYINSKEDLLFAVVREPAERILGELQRIASLDLPPSEKLRQAALTHARVLDETFVYSSVYLREIAGNQRFEEWSTRDREYRRLLTSIVTDGIERGDFSPDLHAGTVTLAFIGSLNWMTHWYRPGGALPAALIADQICSVYLNGLITRSARPATPTEPPRPSKTGVGKTGVGKKPTGHSRASGGS